jgi:hypothetical protein
MRFLSATAIHVAESAAFHAKPPKRLSIPKDRTRRGERSRNDESYRSLPCVRPRGRNGRGVRKNDATDTGSANAGGQANTARDRKGSSVKVSAILTGQVPRPQPLKPGEGAFDRCLPGKNGGGYDLWIKDIRCHDARRWILRLLPTFNISPRVGLDRLERGWQCLTQRTAGTYHYVCVRGQQLIVFSASF